MYYGESSHANKWLLSSQAELDSLRERANGRARDALLSRATDVVVDVDVDDDRGVLGGVVTTEDSTREGGRGGGGVVVDDDDLDPSSPRVYGFDETRGVPRPESTDPEKVENDDDFLSPTEESTLVTFYCSRMPLLIGPHAALPRCRRDAKVASTACLLFRRFYLSNSVMMHDPRTMLAASAFLASKVEDCTISMSCIVSGTEEMNAPVPAGDVLDAEMRLIRGIDFDLLVFSPYKTVLSYTEDMRTFLKTERGAGLVEWPSRRGRDRGRGHGHRGRVELAGEDLRPMHDEAMRICDDVIVSDVPLMFAPGEVGLAALMIANEYVGGGDGGGGVGDVGASGNDDGDDDGEGAPRGSPHIDIIRYIRSRFQDANESDVDVDAAAIDAVARRVSILGQMIRELREGKHGCGNYGLDMDELKGLNKKLKKCRAWGLSDKKEKKEKKKKKKKRKAEDA
jgi:hypothetical protein